MSAACCETRGSDPGDRTRMSYWRLHTFKFACPPDKQFGGSFDPPSCDSRVTRSHDGYMSSFSLAKVDVQEAAGRLRGPVRRGSCAVRSHFMCKNN
jgi:hypothetical protein